MTLITTILILRLIRPILTSTTMSMITTRKIFMQKLRPLQRLLLLLSLTEMPPELIHMPVKLT